MIFGDAQAKAVYMLSKELSVPISDILKNAHEGVPIARKEIFNRRNPASAIQLVHVMRCLEDLGSRWRAFEVPEGQEWNPSEEFFQLNPEVLNNMIAARNISLEQQRDIGTLENGD